MNSQLARGFDLLAAGDSAAARKIARAALARSPRQTEALRLLALTQLHDGALADARATIERALATAPRHIGLLEAKAQILARAGRGPAAVETLRGALAVAPDAASLNLALGELLWSEGRHADAFRAFTSALKASGGTDFRALRGAAAAALALGQLQAGLVLVDRALAVDGDEPNALIIAGHLLSRTGRRDEAVGRYEQALRRAPDNVELLLVLAEHLYGGARHDDAIALFDRALALDGALPTALVMSAVGRVRVARLHEEDIARERLIRFVEDPSPVPPEYATKAAYWAPFLGMAQEVEEKAWRKIEASVAARMQGASAAPGPAPAAAVSPVPAAAGANPAPATPPRRHRLRIGYISPYFGDHAIGHVTRELYGHHDRERFEIFVYPTNERSGDDSSYRRRIRETCDHYRPLAQAGAGEIAAAIRADGIDILIDLNGYMLETKIVEACYLRPAPLQLYWLGHGGGLGLPCYDYVVGDATVIPPGEEGRYVEHVLRLPGAFAPGCPDAIAPEVPARRDEGLAEDVVVFCAFNNPAKVDRLAFSTWLRILAAVPDSQLWLAQRFAGNPAMDNLRAAAGTAGIDPERLVFARRMPDKAAHFARHQLADLFLDTFSVNAATTCLDALWGGLPILTRPGGHFCNRIAASLLRTAGLPELIMPSIDAYVDTALALANDPDRRKTLKARVREACRASALFDTAGFTRGLEAGLLAIWERHRRGRPPATIDVGAPAAPAQQPPGAGG